MSPPQVPRFNVLGVGISSIDLASATERVLQAARSGSPLGCSALAVHAVTQAQSDPNYRLRLNSLDLALPDGQPLRWALNGLHHAGQRERVYGPFLMRSVCAAAALEDIAVFLFGTTPALLDRLSNRLRASIPGIRIAGIRASRFRGGGATGIGGEGERRLRRTSGRPGSSFVALGMPAARRAWRGVHVLPLNSPARLIGVKGAAFRSPQANGKNGPLLDAGQRT